MKKKMKLQLDDLQVETFRTTPVDGEPGTVFGHVYSRAGQFSCDAVYNTCAASCGTACESHNTCDYFTCPGYVSRWDGDAFCIEC
ncbi:MAG TPA: hypothetical protein VF092_26770 [Longimicrobium sp.]